MPLLVRSEPFRDIDRVIQQMLGDPSRRPSAMAMPMDAYRKGDVFLLQFDLPGVTVDAIDLSVDNHTLTVKAERPAPAVSDGVEALMAERPHGTFTRQVFLGDNLDTDKIDAKYDAGVLTLSIPVAEEAKPRRIEVRSQQPNSEITV
ncbi:MAG TPA: Hsp20/alpha crystallin family protein [Acidimicrobiales bacterium]|nr:Hsp20/alpha crystallin family protein [Acidimicrobiales bacterium]